MSLESSFPNLRTTPYQVKSPASILYNCIAWAAKDDRRWWWPAPGYCWPIDAPVELSLEAFITAFEAMGYQCCDSGNLETGFEKIAIYVEQVTREPTHVARQLRNGMWTSKLGPREDIEHTLEGITGIEYGEIGQFLTRPITGPPG